MARRGSFSFIMMVVINPFVILFYQNCSMSPVSNAAPEPTLVREVSSIKEQKSVESPTCHENKGACPQASVD